MYHVGECLPPYIVIGNRTNTRQYIGNPQGKNGEYRQILLSYTPILYIE